MSSHYNLLRGSSVSSISSEIAVGATFGGWARIKFPHVPEKPPEEVIDVKVKSLSTLLTLAVRARWPFVGGVKFLSRDTGQT
jgi:hypothetical protein